MTLTMIFTSIAPVAAISAETEESGDEEILFALEAAEEQEFVIGEEDEEDFGPEIVEEDEIAEDEEIPEDEEVFDDGTLSDEAFSGLVEDEELLTAASGDKTVSFVSGQEISLDLGELPSADALFSSYVDRAFGMEGKLEAASDRTYELEGTDLKIYHLMKQAVEEIADGTRTSTEIEIPLSVFGYSTSTMFTAADLGVDAVVENGKITEQASEAMYTKLAYSEKIIKALLADCPYDLYWYEKTASTSYGMTGIGGTWKNNSWNLYFSSDVALTFKMPVCQGFAGTTAYSTDPAKTGAANLAAQNARDIVSANTSLNDTKKLQAYKNYITEHVSYNTAAADDDTTPYGNPWQLIWVFDEDDTTGVVCEGYSKAFKYLCDCSQFSNPTLECLLVSGKMDGGTGAGAHMWNLVVMGRRSYLADITNSDAGTIGGDGSLFMAGSESATGSGYSVGGVSFTYDKETCMLYNESIRKIYSKNYFEEVDSSTGQEKNEHSYSEWEIVKTPSCSEDGQEAATCDLCGVRQTRSIPKLEHDWSEWHTKSPATCTENTVEECECAVCHEKVTRTVENTATGHNWNDPVYIWEEDNSRVKATRICKNDPSHTETETADAVEEVTESPTCESVGEVIYKVVFSNSAFVPQNKTEELPSLGHDWDEGVVTKAPTCTEPGIRTYTCSRGGETKTEEIAATGHQWDEGTITKAPTCTEAGVRTYTCSIDGETKTEPIAALGHKWEKGTVTTKPTCKAKGVKTYTCQNDPAHKRTEAIAMLSHTWDAGVVTRIATTTAAGVKTYTCKGCGSKRTETIPKLKVPKVRITITKKPSMKKAKAESKGKVTVTWNKFKQTKKTAQIWKTVKKVEIQYSTSKSFAAGVKSTQVKKSATKATLKKLSKNTTYYVRIRYTDGKGGYSAWSAVKKVKTKKK